MISCRFSSFSSMPETEGVKKNRKLRFSCLDDINLLKQAVGLNPYGNIKNWRAVHQNFIKTANKPFTLRAIKDHVEHLFMLYKKKDLANLRRGKAGTEKMYTEKEKLLKELFGVKERYRGGRKRQKLKSNNTSEPAQLTETKEEVLFDSTEDLDLTDPDLLATPSTPIAPFLPKSLENSQADGFCKFISVLTKCRENAPGGMSTGPTLGTLEEEREKEIKLEEEREKEIDLERRKLSLEEKKVELENRRLALEEDRLKYFLESQKQQHQLMLVLIEKITNPNK